MNLLVLILITDLMITEFKVKIGFHVQESMTPVTLPLNRNS